MEKLNGHMAYNLGHKNKEVVPEDSIAVIGMGCILPDALNVEQYWKNITSKKSSIIDIPKNRWSIKTYFNEDPSAKDRSYTKLGAFVKGFEFDSLYFRTPPNIGRSVDRVQKWVLAATKEALQNAGYLNKDFNHENTAVIIGNALGGELHNKTDFRCMVPGLIDDLKNDKEFNELNSKAKENICSTIQEYVEKNVPPITGIFVIFEKSLMMLFISAFVKFVFVLWIFPAFLTNMSFPEPLHSISVTEGSFIKI